MRKLQFKNLGIKPSFFSNSLTRTPQLVFRALSQDINTVKSKIFAMIFFFFFFGGGGGAIALKDIFAPFQDFR